jgi:hypothetical protein
MEIAVMPGTNRQIEALMRALDPRIADLERAILTGAAGARATTLEDLWARRRALRLLVHSRRVEAAEPVVDFEKWRDGNGAIHLCAMPNEWPRKLAR